MLFKLAWRNIWRNSRRSILVLISAIVGLVAILLYDSLSMGMIHQMLGNQIGSHVTHIQIHKNGFNDNKVIQNNIADALEIRPALEAEKRIKHYSERVLSYGILSSASSASGILLAGVVPEKEVEVTIINQSLEEGRYLSGEKHEIVIGRKLAEKLEVGLGDKVVAMASSLDGDIGSDVFRVVGIYSTFSSEFDNVHGFVAMENLQEMLDFGERISEIAMLLENANASHQVASALKQSLGEKYEVLTYQELLPLLVMQVDVSKQAMFVFYAIIGIAMIFGIINTMLMSVLERIQEFGVLMAVGMKNRRLFSMVMLEALLLGITGTVIGLLLGYLCYLPLASNGVDLRNFSDGLSALGIGAIIYPELTMQSILYATLVVPIFSVLGAIYPAIRAVRLNPIRAIRHV